MPVNLSRGSGPWLNYFKDHTVVEVVEDRS